MVSRVINGEFQPGDPIMICSRLTMLSRTVTCEFGYFYRGRAAEDREHYLVDLELPTGEIRTYYDYQITDIKRILPIR